MSLVVSDAGISYQLAALIAQYNADVLRIHLFQNNITPTKSNVLGDFTEATFDGYAAINIGTWSAPAVSGHVASSSPPQVTFSKTAGVTTNNIYGYYVTDAANSVLYWSERDPNGPVPMAVNGDQYRVLLQDTQESKFP